MLTIILNMSIKTCSRSNHHVKNRKTERTDYAMGSFFLPWASIIVMFLFHYPVLQWGVALFVGSGFSITPSSRVLKSYNVFLDFSTSQSLRIEQKRVGRARARIWAFGFDQNTKTDKWLCSCCANGVCRFYIAVTTNL